MLKRNVFFVELQVEEDDLAGLEADGDGVENCRTRFDAQDRRIPAGELVDLFASLDVPNLEEENINSDVKN